MQKKNTCVILNQTVLLFLVAMILFSDFLKTKHAKISLSAAILNVRYFDAWINEIRSISSIQKLGLADIYQEQFQSFESNLIAYRKSEKLPSNPTAYINFLDQQARYLKISFLFMVHLKSKQSPWTFPSYKFEATQGGVSVEAYICTPNQRKLFESTHSGVGKNQIKLDNVCEKTIKSNMKSLGVENKHLMLITERLKKAKHHGEELWIGACAYELINHIKKLKELKFIPKDDRDLYDNFWLQNFTNPMRLEFLLNTAPCEHCQILFKKLREKLNQEGIYLPILIYSIYPYNTVEVEMSQVNVLSFKGEFIPTHIFMDTVYHKTQRPSLDKSSHAKLDNALAFDTHVYQLITQMNMGSEQHTPQALLSQVANNLEKLALSKNDIGVIKAFLNHFPEELKNSAQIEYNKLLNSIEKYQTTSQDALENLFEKLFDIQTHAINFDEKDLENILQLTALLSSAPDQARYVIVNLFISAIFYIILKLQENQEEDESDEEDLDSYLIGAKI